MDQFGIGAGITGAVRVYMHSARATGRTTSLVNSLKNGDRVVFFNQQEADRVKRLCRQRGVEIQTLVWAMLDPLEVRRHGTSRGRTIFDHSWVEQYYLNAIQEAEKTLAFAERDLSGWGLAHEETLAAASEIKKWQGI